ncbi:MAG: nucleotide excision repair endonuclease, partial [Gemmata sp.]
MIEDPIPPVSEQSPDPRDPAAKARAFPAKPGVYLMKDAGGNVIYVGKAKNLRNRASSYFNKEAANDPRIRDWMPLVKDVDYIETGDAIQAVLTEAR